MAAGRPKAFIPLNGVPILVHAIRPFESCDRIQGLYLVLRKEDIPSWHGEILKEFPFKKTKTPVAGGVQRQESVRLGLEAIKEDIDIVLIHDGVRPLVEPSMVEHLLDAMEQAQAVVAAVPAKDTVKIVSSRGQVLETPARQSLWHIQTPQAFEFRTIVKAHRMAAADGFVATDDSTLVERLDVPVRVLHGSYRNIKVTTPEDLVIARALLDNR
jgi:2-C-methyl-D-erythritol 4-phosphate cytidylyltransferase